MALATKRYVFDLETNGLLNEGTLDYSSFPYKLKPTTTIHCGWIIDVDDKSKRWGYRPGESHLLVEKLKEADVIIGHNIINFDLLFLRLFHGSEYSVSEHPNSFDSFCGKPVRIFDTLVLSKVLNPDRKGGHSLKAWGKALDNNKIDFGTDDETEDTWEFFSEEMYVYCEQDVDLNVDVFHAEICEAGSEEDWQLYWEKAFRLEQAMKELTTRQEHFGFDFKSELAESTVTDLNRLLAECEAEAEPHLPPKELSKSKQPKFPAKPFKGGDGKIDLGLGISHWGKKWLERLGLEDADENTQYQALEEQWPVILTEPMKLSSQEDVKHYLVSLGWRPTKWNERDLMTESDKRTPSTEEQFRKRIVTYIEKTVGSSFEEFRVNQIGEALRDKTIDWDRLKKLSPVERKRLLWRRLMVAWVDEGCRKINVYTLPKFVVDMDKNLCPNLKRLSNEIPYSRAIVEWLTYRHRRNSIKSPNGTGWLFQVRSDGRIPTPVDSCGCNTARMKHIGVANVPRVSSLYGAPMRALFGAGKDWYQIGTDGDAIEARVQGHYILPYKGGVQEAQLLLAPKPNDVHTVTAAALGIDRDSAKTVRYSISYGAQPPKLAKDNGWTKQKAQQIFNDFWRENAATAAFKADLTKQWEKTGKRYIIGIDGRKLATRSAHSLLNTQFQSTGVIIMKKAHLISDRKAKAEGYCNDPFVGKPTAMSMIEYHDEDQKAVIKSDFTFKMFNFVKGDEDDEAKAKEACKQFKSEQEATTGRRWSDVGHTDTCYFVAYSRIGEVTAVALEESADYFKMRSPITGGYIVGNSWKDCH